MGSNKILNNYGSFDIVLEKGEGSVLTDVNGKKYIDFLAGIAVNCLGYNYKPLAEAIQKQAQKAIHVCNYFMNDVTLAYADELLSATGFEGVFFGNSGAEANEAAIKLARKYGATHGGAARRTIVTLESSFHGRTMATLTATGQDIFHPAIFAPYLEGFKTIKAGDFDVLKTAFDDTTAALMIECVQGEGGVIPLDEAWAREACDAARSAGAIVICDEVQTGMGRTGTLLSSDAMGLQPEVVTLAKAIAGGIPMGACLYRGSANVFKAGDHQSTFGGNPLAASCARVVLREILKPGFLESVAEKGAYMRERIKSWALPCVRDVRGKGLMIGVQVSGDVVGYETKCISEGLLLSTAGRDVLRIVPPLNIPYKEIDGGLEILRSVLS